MPLLGFMVMRDKIERGEKRQTIRLARKYPIKVGDKLYLYWKLRTKECQRILPKEDYPAPVCTESLRLPWRVLVQMPDIAERDGFHSSYAFLDFFRTRYRPFPETLFDVIRW